MTQDGASPQVGASPRTLGARPTSDIPVDVHGNVHPNTGGVSVAPSVDKLPLHRRPPRTWRDRQGSVWKMNTADLGSELVHVPDSPGHGTIQPSRPMPLSKFSSRIGKYSRKMVKMLISERFRHEVRLEIWSSRSLVSLREILVKYKEEGMTQAEMLADLDDLREFGCEDKILELMDFGIWILPS